MKQISADIEQKFRTHLIKPTHFSESHRGTYSFSGSPHWLYISPNGDTRMLYIDVGGGFDFTITHWRKTNRMAFLYGHDDDAFSESGEEKHEHFSCMSNLALSEEEYFMASTIKELPLPYELMKDIVQFMDDIEDLPVDNIRPD